MTNCVLNEMPLTNRDDLRQALASWQTSAALNAGDGADVGHPVRAGKRASATAATAAKHSRHHGDDVGVWNISAYRRGMMGGCTPNIEKVK
jgi:hypothetical protein